MAPAVYKASKLALLLHLTIFCILTIMSVCVQHNSWMAVLNLNCHEEYSLPQKRNIRYWVAKQFCVSCMLLSKLVTNVIYSGPVNPNVWTNKEVPLMGIKDSFLSSQLLIFKGFLLHSRSLRLRPCFFHLAKSSWYCWWSGWITWTIWNFFSPLVEELFPTSVLLWWLNKIFLSFLSNMCYA